MEVNQNYRYDILLSAPIGDKKGVLTINIFQDKLNGDLVLMKHKNHISGTIDQNGKCIISGTIKTLTKIINYNGSGYIDEQVATLILNTSGGNLIISGKAVKEEM